MIKDKKMDVIISSCCPTVNMLIEKYYPEALPSLAPVLSPMQAHCREIRKNNPEAKIVLYRALHLQKVRSRCLRGYS